jgi:hypothetical protein
MAYVPSLSELDSHQGDAKLAIGGGGSMAGNLPLTEFVSDKTMDRLSQLTDNYVAKKNKEYAQWEQNVAKAYEAGANTADIFKADLPDIQAKKKDFYDFVGKNQYLMTSDAAIKNPKKWQEFKDKEQDLLMAIAKSKQSNILDSEYKKLQKDASYNNPVFQKKYSEWLSTPLMEREAFIPVAKPIKDIMRLRGNLKNYKQYSGNPILEKMLDTEGKETGFYNSTQPYTNDREKFLADAYEAGAADYYAAEFDALVAKEDDISIENYEDTKKKYVDNKILEGIPEGGKEKSQVRADNEYRYNLQTRMIDYRDEKADENWQQRQQAEDNKPKEDKYPQVTAVINEISAIKNAKGEKVNTLGKLEGDVYDVTSIAMQQPNFKNKLVDQSMFMQVTPEGTFFSIGDKSDPAGLVRDRMTEEGLMSTIADLDEFNKWKADDGSNNVPVDKSGKPVDQYEKPVYRPFTVTTEDGTTVTIPNIFTDAQVYHMNNLKNINDINTSDDVLNISIRKKYKDYLDKQGKGKQPAKEPESKTKKRKPLSSFGGK